MDHELLMRDMVTGYRAYVEPADLSVGATTEAPATTAVCVSAVASFSLSFFGGEALHAAVGHGGKQAPGAPRPK